MAEMQIDNESFFLGAKNFTLGMLTEEEVRSSLNVAQEEHFKIDGNGKLGINNTTPIKKLDVSGEVKIGNILNMDNKRIVNAVPENINIGSVNSSECAKLYHDSNYAGDVWNLCPGEAIPLGGKMLSAH